jgi:predicted nucleic acid-binding protein
MSDAKYFVDTNLLLYWIDRKEPQKQHQAAAWLDHLWNLNNVRLSWQVLHEFYSNATRRMRVTHEDARRRVKLFAKWQPSGMSLEIIERGWHWIDTAQLCYWDSLIVASAETLGCSVLLTEDLQADLSYGSVRVLNPFEQAPPRHEMLH